MIVALLVNVSARCCESSKTVLSTKQPCTAISSAEESGTVLISNQFAGIVYFLPQFKGRIFSEEPVGHTGNRTQAPQHTHSLQKALRRVLLKAVEEDGPGMCAKHNSVLFTVSGMLDTKCFDHFGTLLGYLVSGSKVQQTH